MSYNNDIPMFQQAFAMRTTFPDWKVTYSRPSQKIVCEGTIHPSGWSDTYSVRMTYVLGKNPTLEVLSPKLITVNRFGSKIEHVYSGELPCTYYPKAKDWTPAKSITIIVPFFTSWLYFYENWHISNVWTGTGIHPTRPNTK